MNSINLALVYNTILSYTKGASPGGANARRCPDQARKCLTVAAVVYAKVNTLRRQLQLLPRGAHVVNADIELP